jgi:urease accessory protein
LNDGDAVKLEDGSLVLIKAAAQKLIEITAENPLRLARVAWHIGNRHTPAEITANAIYIEHDHVLAEMVRGQGCAMADVERPFQPERGAYDHDHANCGHDHHGHHHHDHGHEHGHDHGHSHAGHDHDHGHEHHHTHAHEHAHGASCGCGHDHHHHDDHGHKHDHGHHGHEHGHKGHKHDH